MEILLTRDDFRNGVFKRDVYKCVICKEPAKDAHHILERRLWEDSGYYLDNGASVCEKCHILAEQTVISCDELRKAAGITQVILPPHLYDDYNYSKWGCILLDNGTRLKGELFFDESVQKILKEGKVLDLYSNHVKYPRTHHLSFSQGLTKDDRALPNQDHFKGKQIVVHLKLDGEQSSLYRDYYHARSLDFVPEVWRNYVRVVHAKIAHEIPEGWRLCCENMWAKHSIHYKNLESFLYLFSMWNEKNECLPWKETKEYADILGLTTCPVLYEGIYDEDLLKSLWKPIWKDGNEMEGFVIRIADGFKYGDFKRSVAKFVRKGHVQTSHHWRERITPNELAPGANSW